jgi:hypothetical protein
VQEEVIDQKDGLPHSSTPSSTRRKEEEEEEAEEEELRSPQTSGEAGNTVFFD